MGDKGRQTEPLVEKALSDDCAIGQLIEGISPERKSHERRDECAETLKMLSDTCPEKLYGRWDEFTRLISSDNAFSVSVALYVIARLASIDRRQKLDGVIDTCLSLVDDRSIVIASRAVLNLGMIAKARPDLERKITARLLEVERSENKQKELLKSHVLEALDVYFEAMADKNAAIAFAGREVESASPKTRKAAQGFLKKHGA